MKQAIILLLAIMPFVGCKEQPKKTEWPKPPFQRELGTIPIGCPEIKITETRGMFWLNYRSDSLSEWVAIREEQYSPYGEVDGYDRPRMSNNTAFLFKEEAEEVARLILKNGYQVWVQKQEDLHQIHMKEWEQAMNKPKPITIIKCE